jgi:peptidoglycan/LPS O-acetylase OafA/YrhL
MDPLALSPAEVIKQMLFMGHHFLANPFWTLALEFRWYFMFPVVLWIWMRSRALFAAIALLSLVTGESALHSYDLFFLPVFMLGIFAAHLYVTAEPRARVAVVILPAALALAIASTAHDGWDFTDRGPIPLWGISMFCLVVAAGASPIARKILSHRWIVAVGAMSYSIYLVHEPLIEFTQRFLHGASTPLLITACSAAAFGMAFSCIAEQPFVNGRLKNLLVGNLQRRLSTVLPDIRADFNTHAVESEHHATEAAELIA